VQHTNSWQGKKYDEHHHSSKTGNPFPNGGIPMTDLLFVGLTIAFLLLSWGFILFCDRLMEKKK
jgi:hypothetical protein